MAATAWMMPLPEVGVQLWQETNPRAGSAGGPRLTGTRLPVLTRGTQDSDNLSLREQTRDLFKLVIG